MKTEVIAIRKTIPVLSNSTTKERCKGNGRVSELRIKFYPGVEKALKVQPFVLHKGGRAEQFLTYPEGTEPFISGDNDYLVFPVSVDFENDDEIAVYAENTNANYTYSLAVDVIVSYFEEEVI